MRGVVPPGVATPALALLAAVAWGGGDFCGGMGTKAAGGSVRGVLRLIITAHTLSLLVLLCILWAQHAGWPAHGPLLWALGAGVVAGVSLAAFYIALAAGAMGAAAAVSGVLAAAIPAGASLWLDGAPSALRIAGFVAAAAAIWLIAASPSAASDPLARTSWWALGLAMAGGVGFGLYFVGLRLANGAGVLEPVALARAGSLAACLGVLGSLRVFGDRAAAGGSAVWLNRRGWLWALGVAVFDTGGNLFFTGATRAGRLDVASVLASLYPASTILLAAFLLHEHPSRRQLLGMAVAVGAVVMITL